MQISSQEVRRARRSSAPADRIRARRRIHSVEELADESGVDLGEVRRFTEEALMAEEDPARLRRVQELARRVAAGTYSVGSEEILDMAERRAIADRSVEA